VIDYVTKCIQWSAFDISEHLLGKLWQFRIENIIEREIFATDSIVLTPPLQLSIGSSEVSGGSTYNSNSSPHLNMLSSRLSSRFFLRSGRRFRLLCTISSCSLSTLMITATNAGLRLQSSMHLEPKTYDWQDPFVSGRSSSKKNVPCRTPQRPFVKESHLASSKQRHEINT
jgi:hypothetical protein